MDWIEEANHESQNSDEILSFLDYQKYFDKFYELDLRPSYKYLIDMFNYYGRDENNHLKVFQQEHTNSSPVFGQFKAQESIYQNLINFQDEGFNSKFILLLGPNGSAKSSLIRKIMKGAEEYSKENEGKLYTFSWIFPIDNYIKGTLGFNNEKKTTKANSYAYLDDKEIGAIIHSELKDHPFLLIPRQIRRKIMNDKLSNNPKKLEEIKKTFFYNGDLSKRNKMIYDALLKSYKGDHGEVLKHIRVERFNISSRYSIGAVTIEPQMHVDARIQQITMDKRLSSLPPSLQSLNLFSLQGEVISANRGILEFSDLLKRPIDAYKYLLQTMETSTLNLNGILTELDIFFVGTSNEIHFQAFKQHPDFNSFKGRFNFVTVPYLIDYIAEEKIYHAQIESLKKRVTFEPHSIKALSLFSVMTRLRKPIPTNYKDKKLAALVEKLTPLEKTFFLSNKDDLPQHFDSESKQMLSQSFNQIYNEFDIDPTYEGKFGISPRAVKKIIYKIASTGKTISPLDIIEYLEHLILKKSEHDFLNIATQGDYHNCAKFLVEIKQYCLDLFDKELRDCLGLIDDRSYEDYLQKYITNINALIKGEKIKNSITGKFEECDTYFISEFEKSINLKESPSEFQSHLISKLGAYALDNPGKKILYNDVFSDIAARLQESFRDEQVKVIMDISKNILFFEAEIHQDNHQEFQLSDEHRNLIKNVLERLAKKYNYTQEGSMTLIKYLIKEKY